MNDNPEADCTAVGHDTSHQTKIIGILPPNSSKPLPRKGMTLVPPSGAAKIFDSRDYSILIPAWNEADRIGNLLRNLNDIAPDVQKLVIDNNSDDDTAQIAADLDATVVHCGLQGKGAACKVGLGHVKTKYVFMCDADIIGLSIEPIQELANAVITNGNPIARLTMERSAEQAPVTTLLVRPLLRVLHPNLDLKEPIGGLLFGRTDWLRSVSLPDRWGVDIAITLHATAEGRTIPEVAACGLSHRQKPVGDYAEMAMDIAEYIIGSQ